MRRTKNRFDNGAMESEQFVSGCRKFEGEDLSESLSSSHQWSRLSSQDVAECSNAERVG